METKDVDNKATVSRSASSEMLDRRASPERGAETLEERTSRILDKYFEKELPEVVAPAFLAKIIMFELREAVIAEREACAEIALKLIPDAADFDAIKTERTRELVLHGANIANAIKDRILRRNTKAV